MTGDVLADNPTDDERFLDSETAQQLQGIRDVIAAAGASSDPQQAIAQLDQAQRQLHELLDAPQRLDQANAKPSPPSAHP